MPKRPRAGAPARTGVLPGTGAALCRLFTAGAGLAIRPAPDTGTPAPPPGSADPPAPGADRVRPVPSAAPAPPAPPSARPPLLAAVRLVT